MTSTARPASRDVESMHFAEADGTPNNPKLPVLLYRDVVPRDAGAAEELFGSNGWGGAWQGGIFAFNHYHSNAHEVLGVVRGRATVRLGGSAGAQVAVAAGDAIALPAGTGHELVSASGDLLVVGAYPEGQENWDLCRDRANDTTRKRIVSVPVPAVDPVHGPDGPLRSHWTEA
jgi:uncharacterized protein YjlB